VFEVDDRRRPVLVTLVDGNEDEILLEDVDLTREGRTLLSFYSSPPGTT